MYKNHVSAEKMIIKREFRKYSKAALSGKDWGRTDGNSCLS